MNLRAVLLVLFFGVSSHAASLDFSKLKVTQDIQPGQWKTEMTVTPKNPYVKDRNETFCITKSELLKGFGGSTQKVDPSCKTEIKTDEAKKAEVVIRCPAMDVPQAGLKIPGYDIPMVMTREASDRWAMTITLPAGPGVGSKSVWKYLYTRLKNCP